jgi:pullulanase
MWGKFEHGEYTELHGTQILKLSPATNSIRFKLKFPRISHGFVIGDFNNWQKSDDYRLTWQMDYNDGQLKLSADITFSSPLNAGVHNFSYILIDIDGNEITVSAHHEHFVALEFSWPSIASHLAIKASENMLYPGVLLELVAVRTSTNNRQEIIDVNWEIVPADPAITITPRGILFSDPSTNLSQITVYAHDPQSAACASRTFNLAKTQRNGQLIHFLIPNGNYQGDNFVWDLWAFDEQITNAVTLSETTDFGKAAVINASNVIARKQQWGYGWHNEWAEQSATFTLTPANPNVYIIYGDNQIYTDLTAVVRRNNPQIEYAVLDDSNKITAYLSQQPPVGCRFGLYLNGVHQEQVEIFVKDELKEVIFTNLPPAIDPRSLIEIRANNTFLAAQVAIRNYLDRYEYLGSDLGVTWNDTSFSIKLWAPTALKVELVLFKQATSLTSQADYCIELEHLATGVHTVTLDRKLYQEHFYLFKLTFNQLNWCGEASTSVTYAVDPYAVAVSINGEKGYLLEINHPSMLPPQWQQDMRPPLNHREDSIIYEAHVRDFTIHPTSGVAVNLRGKFLGMAAHNTVVSDEAGNVASTGLASLAELGITHVHLLPIFDFSSVDEAASEDVGNRNWGYDPQHYNAPEGSYASTATDPKARIKELRQLISSCHQHGIRVVMDVVYNHMATTTNLENIVPGYYFRTNARGKFTNGSGCGNELASERKMVRKLIVDSIVHWLTNYHLDGIRFDLMELIDYATTCAVVKQAQQIDPSILLYGEPWKGGESPQQNGTYRGRQKGQEFAIFNDVFRDAIRGNNNPGQGFVNGQAHNSALAWQIVEGLKGSTSWMMHKPREGINYIDAHDNYTLWDQLEKNSNSNLCAGNYRILPADYMQQPLVRQYLLAVGIILTAQGIPFLQGGIEFLRTKQGDHNSYKSNDHINAFDWSDKLRFKQVFDYIRGLIELRKAHSAFRCRETQQLTRHLHIEHAYQVDTAGVIIAHYTNHANLDSWQEIVVIYNASALDNYTITDVMPKLDVSHWHLVVNHERAGVETIASFSPTELPTMRAHSMMVFHN